MNKAELKYLVNGQSMKVLVALWEECLETSHKGLFSLEKRQSFGFFMSWLVSKQRRSRNASNI